MGGVLLISVTVVGGYKIWFRNYFSGRGVIPEFDYFKKFQVFDFLISQAPAISCHKMRSGGKIFF